MDLGKLQYFEKIESNTQKEFLIEQNNCILCAGPLDLQHIRVESTGEIKEETHCPHCDLRTEAKTHSLQ